MDEFTQNLLERAKMRRQKLSSHLSQISTPQRVLKPLQENNSLNVEPCNSEDLKASASLSSSGMSKLKRLGEVYSDNGECVLSPIHRGEEKILAETPKTPGKSKCRLGRLNELASNINQWEDDLSHPAIRKKNMEPVNRQMKLANPGKPTTVTFAKDDSKEAKPSPTKTINATISMTTVDRSTGKEKTNSTTATIVAGNKKSHENLSRKTELEPGDPVSHKKVPRMAGARCATEVPQASSEGPSDKKFQWDQTIIKSLESQGFSRADDVKLVYEFENRSPKTKVHAPIHNSPSNNEPHKTLHSLPASRTSNETFSKVFSPPKQMNATKNARMPINRASPSKSPKMGVSALDKDSSVLKRAAMFEKNASPMKNKDPAELTLAERKALFEKNKGEAILPKVAFATSLPAKLLSPVKSKPADVLNKKTASPLKRPHLSSLKEKFMNNDLVETTNSNMSKLEREKDLEFLRNRWNRNKEISGYAENTTGPAPPPPPMPKDNAFSPISNPREKVFSPQKCQTTPSSAKVVSTHYKDSPETLKTVKEVKKIVLSPPKEGNLYPSLSDIEVADDETEPTSSSSSSFNNSKHSDMYLNLSFGEILEVSKNNPLTPPPSKSRENSVLYALDEAVADVQSSDDEATPPKQPCISNSFEYSSGSPYLKEQTSTPLIHTVSFYRKQQNNLASVNNTPHKIVKRNEVVNQEEEPADESIDVQLKLNDLHAEIAKQQTYISQASNLLSVCLANIEFSGSKEQVEGERLLLLAAHKRQACLNEIQRLKVEGTLRPRGPNVEQLREQGDLIISSISVPIKREALRTMATEESMLYFVCLIKSDDRVLATPVVAASGSNLEGTLLKFPGNVRLEKLYSDFKATVEVYYLGLNKEMLPFHIKYHLPVKKDKKLLTPIKAKKSQSRLVMPNIQSPAGPNAVRTTNFQMCGYVVFSLRELRRTEWTMNKVPYNSPVEGSMSMRIQSDLQLDDEHRGFLSMFDDVSGLGAWHRRWCLLSAHTLSFWKYPDDETKKIPLGTIDLRSVVTENVGLVSRDVCARLHTFLLETTRPRTPNDTESLVLLLEGDVARVRHLLSADTKEERLDWCARLNKALALIRAWSCQS